MKNESVVEKLAGLDFSTAAGLQDAVVRLSGKGEPDRLLYEGLRYLRRHPQTHRPAFRQLVEELAGFYLDSAVPELAKMMREAHDRTTQKVEKQALMGKDLTGVQLLHSNGRQGVLFLPDASEPGRFRASHFDTQGFYSHITRNTYAQVLEEVWQEGFRPTDTPMLEAWAVTQSWQSGSEVTLAIQQVGLGNMVYAEYLALAQWHSNKATLTEQVKQIASSSLEPPQQYNELQKWSMQTFGRHLAPTVATSLLAEPGVKPNLSAGLFEQKDALKRSSMVPEQHDAAESNDVALKSRRRR